jgi:glycosyltransferase 2 family protein
MDESRRRRIALGFAVGVPVSVLFLWLAFRGTDRGAVTAALGDARPLPLLVGITALGAMYLLQAARWRLIARTPGLGLALFAGMVVGGVAVNNVLPGRLGDLLRARWLAVEARIPWGRALATVVFDRAGDVLALALLLFVSVWGIEEAPWLQRLAIGALVGVLAILVAVAFARLYAGRRPAGRRRRGRVRRFVRDTIEGLAQPLGLRLVGAALALSLAAWLAFSVAVASIASSVGIELPLVDALFVAAVVNLGVAIPSSPGFVGTYQWLIVEALALIPAGTREEGLAFAILLHAAWYVPTTIVGGVVVLTRLRVRGRHAAGLSPPVRRSTSRRRPLRPRVRS